MSPIDRGEAAPPVAGIRSDGGPLALVFYKVTCPVCQIAAPVVQRLADAVPGRVFGIGQDPPEALAEFGERFAMASLPSVADEPPYERSDAYGVEVVPTLVLVGPDGVVDDVVISWDRDGWNRVAARLAGFAGQAPVAVSDASDGLPAFRPG